MQKLSTGEFEEDDSRSDSTPNCHVEWEGEGGTVHGSHVYHCRESNAQYPVVPVPSHGYRKELEVRPGETWQGGWDTANRSCHWVFMGHVPASPGNQRNAQAKGRIDRQRLSLKQPSLVR